MNKLSTLIFGIMAITFCYSQQETGLVFMSEDEYKDIPLGSVPMMGELPETKDLSEWFPKPGNQGNQSSCVGWAVAYGLKSYQESVERRRKPINNSHYYSPSYVYNQIKLENCGNGSYIYKALDLLKSKGVPKLNEFPYDEADCSKLPDENINLLAGDNRIAEWRRVNFNDETEVKSQIFRGFPVIIGMYIDDEFKRLGNNQIYNGRVGQERGGHAMVVVGYDDTKGAYKVLNSWGTRWGTSGYGWISYSAFKQRVKEAYTSQDIVINDPDAFDDASENQNVNSNLPIPIQPKVVDLKAQIGQPIVMHNHMVQSPFGLVPGMMITVPGSINNGEGAIAQLILRFYLPNGQPLIANIMEPNYRDAKGMVATGTQRSPIFSSSADLNSYVFSIPYYALNFPNTNGFAKYNVLAQATLYINDFEKAQSPTTSMTIRF